MGWLTTNVSYEMHVGDIDACVEYACHKSGGNACHKHVVNIHFTCI